MTTSKARSSESAILFPVLALFGVIALGLGALLSTLPEEESASAGEDAQVVAVATPTRPAAAVAMGIGGYDPALVEQGRTQYLVTCAGCHGPDARGITGIGKDLVGSEFVSTLTDDLLLDFIIVGRQPFDPANTTGIPMPARGGNPALSDAQIRAIIAYIRTLASGAQVAAAPGSSTQPQTPAEPADYSAWTPPVPVSDDYVVPLAPFDPAFTYIFSCAACHGPAGEGVPGYGPALAESAYFADRDAEGLAAYIIAGRPFADPRAEFPHPPRGGYPALSDEQAQALVAYLFEMQ